MTKFIEKYLPKKLRKKTFLERLFAEFTKGLKKVKK